MASATATSACSRVDRDRATETDRPAGLGQAGRSRYLVGVRTRTPLSTGTTATDCNDRLEFCCRV
jgi:hypothetical protein